MEVIERSVRAIKAGLESESDTSVDMLAVCVKMLKPCLCWFSLHAGGV